MQVYDGKQNSWVQKGKEAGSNVEPGLRDFDRWSLQASDYPDIKGSVLQVAG
jgi:hypothetical protein